MSKDNPLEPDAQPARPGYRTESRTLWLDADGMAEARENYWRAYAPTLASDDFEPGVIEYRTWSIAWAAAIAAYSFMMEGRISPR